MAQAFGLDLETDCWDAKIAGYPFTVYKSESHVSEVNVLGSDFCDQIGFNPQAVAGHRTVTYYIGPWAR